MVRAKWSCPVYEPDGLEPLATDAIPDAGPESPLDRATRRTAEEVRGQQLVERLAVAGRKASIGPMTVSRLRRPR